MKRERKILYLITLFSLSLAVILSSCGGGGGGGGGGAPSYTLSGTAASGHALAGATVTLKDAAGISRTATTASNGAFSLNTTGLTPPFLLQVVSGPTTLYSVSADANLTTTVNITPLTDLIIRSWYNVQGGVSVDTAFGAPATYPAPSPTAVSVISNVVQNMMQLWLNQAGVAAANFNLISTPFSASTTSTPVAGVDTVLSQISGINTGTGLVTISNVTTSQTSTLTASGGSITVSTVATSSTGTSSSASTTVVPVSTAQQTALNGITATLNAFAGTINAKLTMLTYLDVQPYLDTGLLEDGLNQIQLAHFLAAFFNKGQTASFTVQNIISLDTTSNVAHVVLQISQSQSGQTSTMTRKFFFKLVGSSWLLSGNNRIAKVAGVAEMRTNQGASPPPSGPDLNADVQSPVGTVSSSPTPTVSAGTIGPATMTSQSQIVIDSTLTLDHFFANTGALSASSIPPVGTPVTFVLTPASAPTTTVSYTETLNAETTEPISITSIMIGSTPVTSTSVSAITGKTLTVNWSLPATFPVASVKLHAEAFTGLNSTGNDCQIKGPVLGITATSGTIMIPSMCGGPNVNVLDVDIEVSVVGVNGENEFVVYFFQ